MLCFARTAKHVWPALPGKKYAVRMNGFTGIDSADAWLCARSPVDIVLFARQCRPNMVRGPCKTHNMCFGHLSFSYILSATYNTLSE